MIHKITIKIILLFAFLLASCFGTILSAQTKSTIITGIVQDEFGKPLADVVVRSENGVNKTNSDELGKFTIAINDESKSLIFNFIGYANQKIGIGETENVNVKLKSDSHHLDEVIQLGYSSQLRKDLSGAVYTVSGSELEKSPVANLSQTFAGRFPGMTSNEGYSELSRAVTDIHIRGLASSRWSGPLVIVDGIICAYNSFETLEYITPSEIESVTILKDASTQALYGIQGANGLIVITTKRGKHNGLKINTRFDQSMQQVTTTPTFYNSADYAEMRNQAAYNDGNGLNYLYSDQQIANYRSGEDSNLYPSNNWYNRFVKDFASMQRFGINVSGGNDKVQFFSNLNVMHQGGQFKTDQPRYKTNPNNIWINYRTNIDMKLNKYLGAYINLSGNIKRERTPGESVSTIYSSLFQIPPTMYGPVTPQVLDAAGNVTDKGGKVVTTERVTSPTYGMLNRSGYRRHTVTNITSQFGLNLDLNFITPGLNATGAMAYQTNSVGSLGTTQDYERWIKADNPSVLSFSKKGSNNDTPLSYGKGSAYYYHLTYKPALNYKRDFGKHNVSGMGYMFYQNLTKSDTGAPWCLPYNRVSSGVEATYGYDGRYLLKFDLGYSGSEQFARGRRFLATPAVSVAWVASDESFMKDLKWLSNLKLRASYGKTGNDQLGLNRYAYLDNVTVGGGGPIGSLQYYINENQVGNPYIQAEITAKQNYGIDLGLFNSLSVSVDVFRERMENMMVGAVSTVPVYQGIPLDNYPNRNEGIFENKGYEITANYTRPINKDLTVSLGGSLSYTRNTIVLWNEALRTEDYAYRKREEGYSCGQAWGYLVDYSNGNGFYNSQSEITNDNLTYSMGTPRLGDLRYKDLNNDQVVDEKDKAPIGSGFLPRYYYGINGTVTYKSFDLSFLFQGVGKWSSIYGGTGVYETSYDGVYGSLHRNAWTQERWSNDEKITAPALSLNKSTSHEASDYYQYNRAYLRLKNIEIGYTLPTRISKLLSASKVRAILSGQNLLTWDKMKSNDFGPEGNFESIPVYRVYNIGVSVVF